MPLLQGKRPHIFGMTASPVNTRAKQTQMKVADAVWQLERNMDAQVITVINRGPVVAAAPLPELKLVYYVRQHVSDSLKEVEGRNITDTLTVYSEQTKVNNTSFPARPYGHHLIFCQSLAMLMTILRSFHAPVTNYSCMCLLPELASNSLHPSMQATSNICRILIVMPCMCALLSASPGAY